MIFFFVSSLITYFNLIITVSLVLVYYGKQYKYVFHLTDILFGSHCVPAQCLGARKSGVTEWLCLQAAFGLVEKTHHTCSVLSFRKGKDSSVGTS